MHTCIHVGEAEKLSNCSEVNVREIISEKTRLNQCVVYTLDKTIYV